MASNLDTVQYISCHSLEIKEIPFHIEASIETQAYDVWKYKYLSLYLNVL